jgi:hypothetical protein
MALSNEINQRSLTTFSLNFYALKYGGAYVRADWDEALVSAAMGN